MKKNGIIIALALITTLSITGCAGGIASNESNAKTEEAEAVGAETIDSTIDKDEFSPKISKVECKNINDSKSFMVEDSETINSLIKLINIDENKVVDDILSDSNKKEGLKEQYSMDFYKDSVATEKSEPQIVFTLITFENSNTVLLKTTAGMSFVPEGAGDVYFDISDADHTMIQGLFENQK